jgi:hypothetical protein
MLLMLMLMLMLLMPLLMPLLLLLMMMMMMMMMLFFYLLHAKFRLGWMYHCLDQFQALLHQEMLVAQQHPTRSGAVPRHLVCDPLTMMIGEEMQLARRIRKPDWLQRLVVHPLPSHQSEIESCRLELPPWRVGWHLHVP